MIAEDIENKMLHEPGWFNCFFFMNVKKLMNVFSFDWEQNDFTRNNYLGCPTAQSVTLLISYCFIDFVIKLSNCKNQSDYVGLEKIELHQIYCAIDY